VVLKPTHFKNDEVLLSGYSLGGNSQIPDSIFTSVNYASKVIEMSGTGDFNKVELEKKLKGKNVDVHPYINDTKEGFRGNSTPQDIEPMFQLVYLYFTQPRKDTTAFKAFMSQLENQMKFMKSSPMVSFYDTLYKSVYPGYKRMIIFPTPEQLNQMNENQVYKIYHTIFANAAEFKFFLTGNFSIDTITPLITKYLGSLPTINRQEAWKDNSPKFAKGIVNTTLYKGTEPQGMVGIVMSKPFDYTQKNLLELSMLKEIISIKLIEVIREKMSGVYSPQVMINPTHFPQSKFQFMVMFGCSPKSADKLTKAVFSEVKKIIAKGPTEVDLDKAKEELIRARETDLEKNDFWLNKLESLYYDGTDPASILNFKDRVKAVSLEDLRLAANNYLKFNNYVRVVLKPEKK
jgi:zinc protease